MKRSTAAVRVLPFGLTQRAAAVLLLCPLACGPAAAGSPARIPAAQSAALDGRAVLLPRDLPGRATVLILGFGRKSADPTTAWEKPTRTALAHPPDIGFLDMPMLAEVPGFARGWVVRAIRKQVPDVLKPNLVPITADGDAWKRVAGYDAQRPDAAYVLLVDRNGQVRWSTHEAFTPERFAALTAEAQQLAAETK